MKRTEELKQQIAATKETNEMLKMQIITLPKEIETAKENLQTMHQWEYQTKLIRKQSEVALESTKSAYSTLAAICSSIKQMDGLLTADCDASIQGIEAFAKKLLELGSNKIEKEKKFNRLMSNSDDGDIEIDTNREIGSSDGGYYNNGAGYNNGPNSYSTSTDTDSVIISLSDSSTTSSRFSGKRRKAIKNVTGRRGLAQPKPPSASSSSVQAATANDAALMDKIRRESSSIGDLPGNYTGMDVIKLQNDESMMVMMMQPMPTLEMSQSQGAVATGKQSNIKSERQSNRSQEGSSGNKHKDKENFIDLTLNKDQES
mmetsp:Transcript_43261/g.38494  ORF Transcript_43261/g.38494 Transcript_43261/m.38494 type:complete len:316 (-) Transcript_43261:227-1174(-)